MCCTECVNFGSYICLISLQYYLHIVPISPRVAITPRDTSAIFHIMAGRTNELIERCSFELENVTFEIKVFNSTLAILTGLVAGTRYNISSFAVSNSQGSSYSLAMEYYVFVTAQKGIRLIAA